MIILLVICVMIWLVWGAMFDPEEQKGPVEKVIRHPKKWTKRLMLNWIKDAEDVLRDPESTDEEREKAERDIEVFSRFLSKEELREEFEKRA